MKNNNNGRFNGLKLNFEDFDGKENNNCYTYAINQYVNPNTKKEYSCYSHCQMGNLGGRTGVTLSRSQYKTLGIKKAKEDLKLLGYKMIKTTLKEFVEIEGAWKVAFALEQFEDGSIGDYHWYRQGEDGLWSQKFGCGEISPLHRGKPIIDPKKCCKDGRYNKFVGYYMIIPTK